MSKAPITRGMGSHHSAKAMKDEWLTPPSILEALGSFDLDPCAPVNRPWDIAADHYTADGLELEWYGRVWCNPPYGRETGKWLERCARHGDAIALIFARTETRDWIKHVWAKADAILFLYGRLYFHHVDGTAAKSNSGAPSALISYNSANTRALKSSGLAGKLITLKPALGPSYESTKTGGMTSLGRKTQNPMTNQDNQDG